MNAASRHINSFSRLIGQRCCWLLPEELVASLLLVRPSITRLMIVRHGSSLPPKLVKILVSQDQTPPLSIHKVPTQSTEI